MRARPVYPCVLNQIAFPRSGILPVSTRVSILSRSFTSRCTPEAGQFDKVRRNYREKVEGKQCAPLQNGGLLATPRTPATASEGEPVERNHKNNSRDSEVIKGLHIVIVRLDCGRSARPPPGVVRPNWMPKAVVQCCVPLGGKQFAPTVHTPNE